MAKHEDDMRAEDMPYPQNPDVSDWVLDRRASRLFEKHYLGEYNVEAALKLLPLQALRKLNRDLFPTEKIG